MSRLWLIYSSALLLLTAGSSVTACVVAGPTPHVIDPAEIAIDTREPSRVVAHLSQIKRGSVAGSFSCDDIGQIEIRIDAAVDGRTPKEQMGFLLTLHKGRLPRGLMLPKTAVLAGPDRTLFLVWPDGAGTTRFSFELTIQAVDAAGNIGKASLPVIVRTHARV